VSELTPVMKAATYFAYVGGAAFTIIGILLSYRRGRPPERPKGGWPNLQTNGRYAPTCDA